LYALQASGNKSKKTTLNRRTELVPTLRFEDRISIALLSLRQVLFSRSPGYVRMELIIQ
jgi:hypothetical protein